MDELIAGESALQLKERLLEQEKELLMTQNEWMTQELENKSDQLIQLRKERSSTVGELEGQLATSEEEVCSPCVGPWLSSSGRQSPSSVGLGLGSHSSPPLHRI